MGDMKTDNEKLDRLVAETRQANEARELGYRRRALSLYPHICGRCSREFTRENLHELTVHHRDHNHDNNPQDGSNWELLCIYCHDNEHQRLLDAVSAPSKVSSTLRTGSASYQPFADIKSKLGNNKKT